VSTAVVARVPEHGHVGTYTTMYVQSLGIRWTAQLAVLTAGNALQITFLSEASFG
jgi:hypothetical protein